MKDKIFVSLLVFSISLGMFSNICISSILSSKDIEKSDENPKALTLKGDYSSFLSTIFNIDGSIYVDKNKNTFYSSPECKKSDAISNSSELHFISSNIQYGKNSDGFSVYCMLTEEGKIVYCLSSTPVNFTNIDFLE